MSGREFFSSTPGRLACATGAFAFGAPAAMAFAGPSAHDIQYSVGILVLCTVASIAAAVLSVPRFPLVALAYGALVPFVAWFYVAGLTFMSQAGTGVGLVLGALALLPIATAVAAPLRPSVAREPGVLVPAKARSRS
jgi:hypothetical protein